MDSDQGKMFIGGISWETSENRLKEYFDQYGDISQTVVMRDKVTGRPCLLRSLRPRYCSSRAAHHRWYNGGEMLESSKVESSLHSWLNPSFVLGAVQCGFCLADDLLG